jgi:hypothetical protein
MKILATLFVLAIVAIAALLLFIYSGVYNVAATVPHAEVTYGCCTPSWSNRYAAVRQG